jgi:dihydroorotase
LRKGECADITILDPKLRSVVRAESFLSRSRNTPFEGWELQGGPAVTVVQGKVVWGI